MINKTWFLAYPLLLLFALPIQAEEIYRCQNSDGSTLYQQAPCQNGNGVVVEDRTSHYESDAHLNNKRRKELLDDAQKRIRQQEKENRAYARAQQRANKEKQKKLAQCNRINKRIESLNNRIRRKSKINLRRQRDRLWDEHHQLGCSLFIK